MKNRNVWIALSTLLLTALVWLAFFWHPDQSPVPLSRPVDNTAQGGDFRLDSPDGPVALNDFRGKVVAIYFGYTFCPDVCPTSLVALAQAFTELTPAELDKTKGLFISVDPQRDTLEVLKIYVPYFHPSITGLRGSEAQIAEIATRYGVRYMKQKANSDGQYPVDQSSFTYLIGPDGKLAASLPHGTLPPEIVAKIRALLPQ